jgi:hypothetical protein
MAKAPAFAKAFAGRWRIVEMDNWGTMRSSTSSSRRISASRVRRTAKSHSARSRASSTFATAHATDPPVQSSRGKDKTKMTPPAVADGPQSVRQGALSGTSTSTTATIQASSASATDFFNTLLGLALQSFGGEFFVSGAPSAR